MVADRSGSRGTSSGTRSYSRQACLLQTDLRDLSSHFNIPYPPVLHEATAWQAVFTESSKHIRLRAGT